MGEVEGSVRNIWCTKLVVPLAVKAALHISKNIIKLGDRSKGAANTLILPRNTQNPYLDKRIVIFMLHLTGPDPVEALVVVNAAGLVVDGEGAQRHIDGVEPDVDS
jgi:hypothetical protein